MQAPTLPWVQTTGSTCLPWVEALEIACAWSQGATTLDEAAGMITQRYNSCGVVAYDTFSGSTMYGFASYNLTEMIERLNGGPGLGALVNCTDSANSSNTDRFFNMILRRVFADPALSHYLLYRQNESQMKILKRHGHKLDEIGNQLTEQGRLEVPLQRPTRTEHFTGREKEKKTLLSGLQPGTILALCGPGGHRQKRPGRRSDMAPGAWVQSTPKIPGWHYLS